MRRTGRILRLTVAFGSLAAVPVMGQEKREEPARQPAVVQERSDSMQVHGQVVRSGGLPVERAAVIIGTLRATTDSAGRFEMRAPAASVLGPWDQVTVSVDSVEVDVLSPELSAIRSLIAAEDTVRITIEGGATTASFDDRNVRELLRRLVRGQGLDGMLPEVPGIRLPSIAADLGLPTDGLESAINTWIGSAVAPYDLGLGALYEGRFGDALAQFRSISVPDAEGLLGLARAQFGSGANSAGLESVLSAVGMDSADVNLGALADYGMGLFLNGRLADADSVLSRVLGVSERSLGSRDAGLLDALTDLAGLRAVQARYEDSQALLDRAIAIAETSGPGPVEGARISTDLGEILAVQGRLNEADSVFRRADAVLDPASSALPLTAARAKIGLGHVYGATGFLVGADSMNAEAILVLEAGLANPMNDRPVHRAQLQNDLAGAYFAANDPARAEQEFQASLHTLQAAGDSLHPAADEAVARLSALYVATDRLPEAEETYRDHLDQREQAVCGAPPAEPPEGGGNAPAGSAADECLEAHPAIAQARNDLAVVLDLEGNRDEADSLYRSSLLGLQKSVGYQHPATLVVNENLARNRRRLPWGRTGIEFSAFIGSLNDWPEEYNPDVADDQLRRDALVGVRLGYTFPVRLFVQAEAFNSLLRVTDTNLSRQNLQVFMYGLAVGYNIQLSRGVQVFPVIGAGAAYLKPDRIDSETDLQINGGFGVRGFLTPHIAVRFDARVHKVYDPLSAFRQQINPGAEPRDAYLTELAAGISYFHGEPFDSDEDGIQNKHDACPDTPPGVPVDAIGCAADSDRDGVPDHEDLCPATPLGASVNPAGCPGDVDGDGVPDGLDQCDGTELGSIVDFEGCAIDSDDDGIPDGLDACPAEAQTGNGEGGCPQEAEVAPAPVVSSREWAMIEFADGGPLTLSLGAMGVLDAVVDSVAAHPGMRVEIRGHASADSGTPEQNWQYSALRAEIARDYVLAGLQARFPAVAAERKGNLIPVAAGTSLPLDMAETAEAEADNRRVQIVARPQSSGD